MNLEMLLVEFTRQSNLDFLRRPALQFQLPTEHITLCASVGPSAIFSRAMPTANPGGGPQALELSPIGDTGLSTNTALVLHWISATGVAIRP